MKARVRYRQKNGKVKVYVYDTTRTYYLPAVERCRRALYQTPLIRVWSDRGACRWRAGRKGHVFNDATVTQLIESGFAVCHGDFVELKGKVR